MRTIVCALASVLVFAGCTGAWWTYWPVWQVESQVKTQLPTARSAQFSSVTYNRDTRTGCGYVSATERPGVRPFKTHFILMPDGSLKLDPTDRLQGSSLQQLDALRKHVEYLSLVYAGCATG